MTIAQDQKSQATPGTVKKKGRSPAYPAIDLPDALQKAEVIRKDSGRNPIHVDGALALWKYNPKSGTGLAALSALIKFGLLEDEGQGDERRVHLTPLATKILLDDRPESSERLAAVREAALRPSIHKELWDKYQSALPSDATLRIYLRRDRGFQDDAADWCIQEFRNTLNYARLPESGNMSSEGEDKTPPDGELKMTPPETIEQPLNTVSAPVTTPKTLDQSKGSTTPVNRTVQIPLTGAPWALLQVPYPMTESNWAEMEEFLKLMKKPLTTAR